MSCSNVLLFIINNVIIVLVQQKKSADNNSTWFLRHCADQFAKPVPHFYI